MSTLVPKGHHDKASEKTSRVRGVFNAQMLHDNDVTLWLLAQVGQQPVKGNKCSKALTLQSRGKCFGAIVLGRPEGLTTMAWRAEWYIASDANQVSYPSQECMWYQSKIN